MSISDSIDITMGMNVINQLEGVSINKELNSAKSREHE